MRILGTACGLGVEGSGWVARPGEVVTNAHVVAGENDTTVQPDGTGPQLPATAILFDPHNDIAVLRVSGLLRPALRLASPTVGEAGAILGYPLDGPFDARAARLGPTEPVLSQDAYGNGPILRPITVLRGLVRHGNSGGPVVDAHGRVETTVFAASTSRARTGFGVPDDVVAAALSRARRPVSTGPCTG